MTPAMQARFRRRYGASPLHLLAHLCGFAIIALPLDRIFSGGGGTVGLLLWYVGLVVGHDLVLVPAYSGLDRLLRATTARMPRPAHAGPPVINHIRAPLVISALLFILYFPLISQRSNSTYFAMSGHHLTHYLRNWLLITAVLFLVSAVVYAARVVRTRVRLAP